MSEENPTPPADPTPPTDPTPPADQTSWIDSLDDDSRALVEKKGWQDIGGVIKSYSQLEGHMGVGPEYLVKIPTDDEGWDETFKKLGRPDEANGYEIEVEGADQNPGLVEFYQNAAHKAGLNQKQLASLVADIQEYSNAEFQAAQEAAELENTNAMNELRNKVWGSAFEKNEALAANTAKSFGVDFDGLKQAIGEANALQMFAKIGEAMGESDIPGVNDGDSGVMTPEKAQQRINDMKADPEIAKSLMDKMHPAHKKNQDEWKRLHNFLG